MRSSILKVLPLVGTLFVAGCGTTNPFTGSVITPADVQAAAVSACGFLPTVSSVAALITASPAVGTAVGIASLICAAVVPAKSSARLRAVAPTVNGVVIHGRFVN